MSAFDNITEITDRDRKFTELCRELQKELDDNFVSYDTYYGYKTNELHDFMDGFMKCDLYEDTTMSDEDDNLFFFWVVSKPSVNNLMRWLANWDMIVIGEDGLCDVKNSNHPKAAEIINTMYDLCK